MLDETVFRGRRLAIVGSICRDVKMGAIRPGQHLLEDGETPTAFITETIGGGGANSALAAAALGADVRFCGKVGADPLGQRLEQALRPPRRDHVHSPRSAGGHRQFGRPELRERLPPFHQLPARTTTRWP